MNATELKTSLLGFACDLHRALAEKEEGNLFCSPYSIAAAVSMVHAGAGGQTRDEIRRTLKLDVPDERVPAAMKVLSAELRGRSELSNADMYEGKPDAFELTVANGVWLQRGFDARQEYLDLLRGAWEAAAAEVDFAESPGRACEIINNWVSDKTKGKIDKVLDAETLSPDTRMVLGNAVYFKAAWAEEFEAYETKQELFRPAGGKPVKVPMMCRTENMVYAKADGVEVLRLPYLGGQVSMMVFLPADLAAFERSLDGARLQKLVSTLEGALVELHFPKFKMEKEYELSGQLADLGMPTAFTDAADFSGISGKPLGIGQVIHKTFVEVDEKGTEAAGVTMMAMLAAAYMPEEPPKPIVVRVDRPFLFLIYDAPTGTPIFLGRVADPTAG